MQEINTTEQTAEVTPVTVEETLTEQTLQSDIQTDNGETAVSYGKFKSADSLYEGYQQLEKEFTVSELVSYLNVCGLASRFFTDSDVKPKEYRVVFQG